MIFAHLDFDREKMKLKTLNRPKQNKTKRKSIFFFSNRSKFITRDRQTENSFINFIDRWFWTDTQWKWSSSMFSSCSTGSRSRICSQCKQWLRSHDHISWKRIDRWCCWFKSQWRCVRRERNWCSSCQIWRSLFWLYPFFSFDFSLSFNFKVVDMLINAMQKENIVEMRVVDARFRDEFSSSSNETLNKNHKKDEQPSDLHGPLTTFDQLYFKTITGSDPNINIRKRSSHNVSNRSLSGSLPGLSTGLSLFSQSKNLVYLVLKVLRRHPKTFVEQILVQV